MEQGIAFVSFLLGQEWKLSLSFFGSIDSVLIALLRLILMPVDSSLSFRPY